MFVCVWLFILYIFVGIQLHVGNPEQFPQSRGLQCLNYFHYQQAPSMARICTTGWEIWRTCTVSSCAAPAAGDADNDDGPESAQPGHCCCRNPNADFCWVAFFTHNENGSCLVMIRTNQNTPYVCKSSHGTVKLDKTVFYGVTNYKIILKTFKIIVYRIAYFLN